MSSRAERVRLLGPLYVLGVVVYLSFNYYVFVFLTVGSHLELSLQSVILLIAFHISFFMFLWSFFATSLGDPGRVPGYWRYNQDTPDPRLRKICQTCQTAKPDRCHHCSICNACVMNMDHHCPWVHNCIGYWNRKFFMLMLFYIIITSGIMVGGSAVAAVEILIGLFTGKGLVSPAKDILIIVSFLSVTVLLFVMLKFTYKHVKFVRSNTTTIEELDQERGNTLSNYDIGATKNWEQVFGANCCFWFLPIWTESNKPATDGITWEKNDRPRERPPIAPGSNEHGRPEAHGQVHGQGQAQNVGLISHAPNNQYPAASVQATGHYQQGHSQPTGAYPNVSYSPFQ